MTLRRCWLGLGVAALIAAAGLQRAPSALAADAAAGPTLSVTPSAVSPGQPVRLVYHMASVPANFPLPNCQTLDLVSTVVAQATGIEGSLATTTVTGSGDFSASATIPAAATLGTYAVEARACGVTWAFTKFQVTMPMPATGAGLGAGGLDLGILLLASGSLLVFSAPRRKNPVMSTAGTREMYSAGRTTRARGRPPRW